MEKQIVDLAKKLIAVPSVSGNIRQSEKVLRIAERELKGFKIRRFTKNKIPSLFVYTGKKATDTHKLILNLHLDVVPADKKQFNPKITGNRLFGRGSKDMKASAAVNILLFKELARDLPYPIALQIVTDEEIGGRCGTGYQLEKGINAEFALTGEYSGLMIDRKAKGILRIKLTARGKTSHAAYPWEGDNAVLSILKAIRKIHSIYPVPRKRGWKTTATLTDISTENVAHNKVPHHAEAIFDIRYVPRDEERIISLIEHKLPENVTMEILRFDNPVFTNEKDPFIKTLKSSIQIVTGEKAKKVNLHGSSDLRFYHAKGIPSAGFGPKGENQHADNEWVNIKSLMVQYEILKDFLLTV